MSYGHFSIEEREIIAVRLAEGENPTQIAKELGRYHSSVFAEIRRNSIDGDYYPARAQALSDQRRRESKSPWKKQAIEGMAESLSDGRKQKDKEDEEHEGRLYQQIGQLQFELDWLKKSWRALIRSERWSSQAMTVLRSPDNVNFWGLHGQAITTKRSCRASVTW